MFGTNPTLRFPGNLMQVRSINELRGVSPYEMSDEAAILVTAAGLFTFDASSMANDDGVSIIRPDGFTPLQSGRWVSPVTTPPSADNTFATLAALQASGLDVAYLVGDPANADGVFIKSGGTLVRQTAGSISYDATRTVTERLNLSVYATDARFAGGAKGDGVTDDLAAIQAALDYVGGMGGGEVFLPLSLGGRYRITAGLKMPSYTALVGVAPSRYPFNAGNASTLVADFSNQMQWVIDTKTTHGGTPFAYNEITTTRLAAGGLPDGPTFNCSVRNMTITSTGTTATTIPYGGIRMIGCPGSIVDNVGVQNIGTGLLVNCCFGGNYSVHCLTAYYGVVCWDDVNANSFELYCARQESFTGVVPDAYQTAAYSGLFNTFVANHGMAKNDHFNRSTGLIFGSAKTTSGTNVVEYTGERWQNGFFSLYAYALHFTKFYVESGANIMLTAVAGARSNITFATFHSYLSGTGEHFDTGFVQNMSVSVNGITFAAGFGTISMDTQSYARILCRSFEEFGPLVPQFNIVHEKIGAWKAPAYINGGTDVANEPFIYRKELNRVHFDGSFTVPSAATASVLPVGYRPPRRVSFSGGYITPGGEVVATGTTPVNMSVVSFEAIP